MSQPSPDASLPTTVDACHALIAQLRAQLQRTRQSLAVHEENQRREFERMYGKGTTAADLLNFGRAMAKPPSEAEQAAEDAMFGRRKRAGKKS